VFNVDGVNYLWIKGSGREALSSVWYLCFKRLRSGAL